MMEITTFLIQFVRIQVALTFLTLSGLVSLVLGSILPESLWLGYLGSIWHHRFDLGWRVKTCSKSCKHNIYSAIYILYVFSAGISKDSFYLEFHIQKSFLVRSYLVWLGNFEDASPMYTEVHPRVHLAGEWVDVAWQGTWKAQSEGNCGVNCLVITMMFNTWMVSWIR